MHVVNELWDLCGIVAPSKRPGQLTNTHKVAHSWACIKITFLLKMPSFLGRGIIFLCISLHSLDLLVETLQCVESQLINLSKPLVNQQIKSSYIHGVHRMRFMMSMFGFPIGSCVYEKSY